MKICSKCAIEKPLSEFFNRKWKKKSSDGNGKNSYCKECEKKDINIWRKKNPEKYSDMCRRHRLKRVYGITPEQYDELLLKQNGNCAICGRHHSKFKIRLAVEHNHSTKEIQGLCCAFCNSYFLGRHRDPSMFRRAADYLEFSHTGWFVPEQPKKKRKKRK